jgi:hypothetical protein
LYGSLNSDYFGMRDRQRETVGGGRVVVQALATPSLGRGGGGGLIRSITCKKVPRLRPLVLLEIAV